MKTYNIDPNEVLERGQKWEELRRFGDALLAYKIGLEAHPNHRELLKALARLEARADCSLPASMQATQAALQKKYQETKSLIILPWGSMQAAQAALQKGDRPTVLLQLHNVSTILAQQKDIRPHDFIDMLARIGLIYEKTGDLRMFALNLADVCAYAELHFPGTRDTAMDYHYLSEVLEKLGNHSDARRMQERAAFHFQSTNDWTKYEPFHLKRMESLQAKAATANGPNLLATYILRELTTPSEEEAKNYLLNCLRSIYPQNDVDALLRRSRIDQCTNLTQSGDVSKMMDDFIRGSGNEQFLDFPTHYEIKYFQIQTGKPAEPTCIALVFGPDPEQFDPHLVDAASIAASQGDTQNAARLLRRAQEQGVIQGQSPHKATKRGLVGRLRNLLGGTLNQGRTFPKDLNTTSCPKCKIPYSITTFSKQVAVAYPNPNRGELLPIKCSECDYVTLWKYQGEW